MTDIAVRAEAATDHRRVFEIEEAAFGIRLQADLVEALRRSPERRISLVAEIEGDVVGHIFFSPVRFETEHEAPAAAQLSPVAVEPRHQGKGVGSALIRAGLEQCSASGWQAVFLVGNPRYYSRFGFVMAGPRGFSLDGPHDAFLQLLELESGALSGARGEVRFHPAFAALEDE